MTVFSLIVKTAYSIIGKISTSYWQNFTFLSGGQLWGAVEEGELHGLCFCLPEEEKLIIKEMVCRDKNH